MTTFENKCAILADIWINYRNDEQFEDFINYNDLGLPLAYMLDSDIVAKTDKCVPFVEETFQVLLDGLGIDEDTGFESIDDII